MIITEKFVVKRRLFIRNVSLTAAGLCAARVPLFAEIETSTLKVVHNIDPDKHIDPAWLASIHKKSGNTRYLKTKNELKYIGMPCGGLHAGTVYFGGDGRLWLWQVFNQTWEGPENEGIEPKTVIWNDGIRDRKVKSRDGANYIEPTIASNKRVLEQGISIKINWNGKVFIKELKEDDWDEVVFEATYPIATVSYIDHKLPVEVSLQCFSPFIPLDQDQSSYPATILNLKVKNTSHENMKIDVVGWLENGCSKIFAKKESDGTRINEFFSNEKLAGLSYSFNANDVALNALGDAGTMCFSLLASDTVRTRVNTFFNPWPLTEPSFSAEEKQTSLAPANEKLLGSIAFDELLQPGGQLSANYLLAWHFPNPCDKLKRLCADANDGYFYAARFENATVVARDIAQKFKYLDGTTRLWQETWYSSTLPDWFLERSIIPINTLATANTYRFKSGRFWSWEGVGACPGTCTHVWQYAHAMGRIFPALERDTRERVDLGTGFVASTGAILFRGEDEKRPAIDGQAGTILRFYREHQMAADAGFLNRNWPRMKQAIQFMLLQDKNGDGMNDTPLENTLDAVWEGEIAWIVGLCIAAAKAGEHMATEANDTAFALVCKTYAELGAKNMKEKLFNGEYFIHRPDPVQGRKKLGSYNTCHIDQVYGQSWAYQVGMGRIIDHAAIISALNSIWKYNFSRDLGPYLKTHPGGRPYVLPGEGGIIINTNPKNEEKPYGEQITWQVEYFHECQSGYEHEVIAHLMAEGMTDRSMIAYHTIYDRYHAAKRNPYNEIECSDHYARAMASYGTFITTCGFEYHGPKKYIAFNPKLNAADFRAAFTSAEGWGEYKQQHLKSRQLHQIDVRFGRLDIQTISYVLKPGKNISSVKATLNGVLQPAVFKVNDGKILISLKNELSIQQGQTLGIEIS